MPLIPVNAACVNTAQPVDDGVVPIETEQSTSTCCGKPRYDGITTTPVCSEGSISRFRISVQNAAAEYGRLALWTYFSLCPGLSTAFAAAGRCIGARDRPRRLTRLVSHVFVREQQHNVMGRIVNVMITSPRN